MNQRRLRWRIDDTTATSALAEAAAVRLTEEERVSVHDDLERLAELESA